MQIAASVCFQKVGGDNLILCPPLPKSWGDMSPKSPPRDAPGKNVTLSVGRQVSFESNCQRVSSIVINDNNAPVQIISTTFHLMDKAEVH